MASLMSIIKTVMNVNSLKIHIENIEEEESIQVKYGVEHPIKRIVIRGRPYKSEQCKCPDCQKKCPVYDRKAKKETLWRGPDANGIPLYIAYKPTRIECPEHGVKTEYIPWADGESHFTEDFNNEVAWLSRFLPRTAIAAFFNIAWATVGNCIKAACDRLEPDKSQRLRNLRRICVDEVSYKKGYKYITVVYDMDRNRVVWIHLDHGYEVFKIFCELLSKAEREKIEIIAGDGARWIDQCREKFFPNAVRCVDFFHVTEWAGKAMDQVRIQAQTKATKVYEKRKKEIEQQIREMEEAIKTANKELEDIEAELASMPKRGRCSNRKKKLISRRDELLNVIETNDKELNGEDWSLEELENLGKRAKDIKGSRDALRHAPENRTENQDDKIKLIENSFPDVYRAFQLKEQLRLILHLKDVELAEKELDDWMKEAEESGLPPMKKLAEKIGRHKDNILNAIKWQANSAKSESTNTTIRVLIKIARGFRNMDHLMALIYLRCSDIVVPLNNRPQPTAEYQARLRERQNELRKRREEQRREEKMVA